MKDRLELPSTPIPTPPDAAKVYAKSEYDGVIIQDLDRDISDYKSNGCWFKDTLEWFDLSLLPESSFEEDYDCTSLRRITNNEPIGYVVISHSFNINGPGSLKDRMFFQAGSGERKLFHLRRLGYTHVLALVTRIIRSDPRVEEID